MEKEGEYVELKNRVKGCIERGMLTSASLFASKLVSCSKSKKEKTEAISLLARSYHLNGQNKRAYHLLETEKLMETDLNCRLLAAQCLLETKEYEKCISMLDKNNRKKQNNKETEAKSLFDSPRKEEEESVEACLFFVKGKAFEQLENRERAIFWYKKALEKDVFCYEAFERLVGGHMLTGNEEMALLSRLTTKSLASPTWLKEFYSLQLNRYQRPLPLPQEVSNLQSSQEMVRNNAESLRSFAELYYYHNRFHESFDITSKIIDVDPFNFDTKVYAIHLSCLVELNKKTDLFYVAHKLVEEESELSIGWYAVGCYYYLIGKFEAARNYFRKATTVDPHFGEAWLAFAHSFSAQGEHDQSMAAYRNASRMLIGCHLPPLCIGLEYTRVNNLSLARKFLVNAKEICSFDPLLYNELGAIAYKENKWEEAADCFLMVLKLVEDTDTKTVHACWEPTIFNLAHCYRKLQMFDKAMEKYQLALSISPSNYTIYSAIGFTFHLQDNLEMAMDYYHRALGINSKDSLSSDLLKRAMEDCDYSFEIENPLPKVSFSSLDDK